MKQILLIFIFCCFAGNIQTYAQAADSLAQKTKDSLELAKQNKKRTYSYARRASIMSAMVPGLGQVYNRKYWKVPIIYGGLGGFGYMFLHNNQLYNDFRQGVLNYYGNDTLAIKNTGYTGDQLQTQKLYYKKYRDFALIGFAIVYAINIIDANVDGHLRTFDVSDDLSLHIDPWQNIYRTSSGYRSAMGLSVKINFR